MLLVAASYAKAPQIFAVALLDNKFLANAARNSVFRWSVDVYLTYFSGACLKGSQLLGSKDYSRSYSGYFAKNTVIIMQKI